MSFPGGAKVLTVAFLTSGMIHLVRPRVFAPAMPRWVPAHRAVILGSGIAELVCAAGMVMPSTRRLAGWASAALLVGVFPANIQMAIDAARRPDPKARILTLARLPLQLPLIWSAVRLGRGA